MVKFVSLWGVLSVHVEKELLLLINLVTFISWIFTKIGMLLCSGMLLCGLAQGSKGGVRPGEGKNRDFCSWKRECQLPDAFHQIKNNIIPSQSYRILKYWKDIAVLYLQCKLQLTFPKHGHFWNLKIYLLQFFSIFFETWYN